MNTSLRSLFLIAAICLSVGDAPAQQALSIKPLVEKQVQDLPSEELFWRIDNFAALKDAQEAATPWSLVAESAGKVWLFTLGSKGSVSPKAATRVSEVGPIARIAATNYLLRINEATGAPGSVTPVHSHPGSEAFFVLAGQQSIRGSHGTLRVDAGRSEAGHGADQAMQVSSSGSVPLHALVMFVVDATRPFSSPASLP